MKSVEIKIDNGIATILLNQPEYLNALTASLKDTLYNALLEIENNTDIKVAIINGKGRAFCAGGDLKAMGITENPHETKRKMELSTRIIQKIRETKKPIIAAVHGVAAGAGFSMALACDLIIAEEDARFILSFKNVGLIPDLGAHYFLARKIGSWKAKEWFWLGKEISAKEGEQLGFVNYVVSKGEGYQKSLELAQELAKGPIQAFALTKSILNQSHLTFESVIEMENYAQTLLRGAEDHKEGVRAFHEKRLPKFTGK